MLFQIFLRELISNASDALDKVRLMSLTDDTALDGNEELTVKIKVSFTSDPCTAARDVQRALTDI